MRLLKAFVFSIFLTIHCLAQTQTTGSITGTIADSTGAVLAGSSVTLMSNETSLTRTATSQASGFFQFTDVPLGTYKLTIEHSGFAKEEHQKIIVQGNRTTTLDVRLKPGETSETVNVTGTPLLNQEDTTNGYVLDSSQLQTVPLPTEGFTTLALLSPGVNADFVNGNGTNTGLGNQNIWANGNRNQSNTFTFNSVNANNLFNGWSSSQVSANRAVLNTGENFTGGGVIQTNTSIYDAIGQAMPTPPVETIEEMRVNTSMYDASQGSTSGAQIDIRTKSGTNTWHGSAYAYHATDWLNADPFFYKQQGLATPPLHRTIYGATIGGPVVKDKLFFFGSYQGTHVKDEFGSLSEFNSNPYLTNDRSLAGLEATAVANGIAPGTTLDPVAVKILQAQVPGGYLVPTPNVDPGTHQGSNTELLGPSSRFFANQFNANMDYNISNNDVLSEKYYFQNDPTSSPFSASNVLGFPQTLKAGSQSFALDNNTILSPHVTWDQKFGFLRMTALSFTQQPLTPQDVGMNLFGSTQFPGFYINDIGTGTATTLGPSSNFSDVGLAQNRFEGTTNLNWVLGNHTLSFGANYDYTQLNILNRANSVAQLGFNTFADFLTANIKPGEENSVFFQGSSNRYYRAPQVGAYAVDKWHVKPNLVLTLGIRYDWDAGLTEKYGHLVNFDPSAYQYDPASDTIVNSGLVIAGNNSQYGTKGASNSTLTGRQWGLAPRIGVAWTPLRFDQKITFRAGFGIYYDRGEYFTDFSPSAGFGFNGPFGVTLQPPFTQPILTVSNSLANPFGTTPPSLNFNPNTFNQNLPNVAALMNGTSPYLFGAYDPRNKLPYTENYSLDIQWQMTNSMVFDLGYVGNHGLHETLPIPFNMPYVATAQNPINGQTSSYGYNAVASETVFTAEGGNTDLRVPYLGYSINSVFWEAAGISHYNALQAHLRRSLASGLQTSVAYTWSHALDEGSGYGLFFNGNDPRNLRSAYASADFDRTNVFNAQIYYELPNYSGANGVAKRVLNGWSVGTIAYLESGQPYNVYDYSGTVGSLFFSTNDYLTNPVLPLRAGMTPQSAIVSSGAFSPAFNASAFAVPLITPGTMGVPVGDNLETGWANGGRNIFRGPFQKRADVSVSKNVQITERCSAKFRFDLFNVTNTPSFDAPNNNVTGNPSYNGSYDLAGGFASGQTGLIQHTLGSPRQYQMSLHVNF